MRGKTNVRRGSGRPARVISGMGILIAICGICFRDVIGEGFSRMRLLGPVGPNPGRVQFWDLESAFGSTMEPIVVQQTASKPREVTADDSIGGEPVTVTIQLEGLPRQIHGDNHGVFPPITVRAHQRVHVRVSYPEGNSGEVVQIQTQDGGTLENDLSSRVLPLDERRSIAFWFESSGNEGTHRVTIRRGFDEKTLDFWVGSKPALHVVR